MSRGRARLVLAVVGLATGVVWWLALAHLQAARSRASAAESAAASVERDTARLQLLRAARPTVGQGAEPQSDALALLNAALADATLPATHVRSLSPDAQNSLAPQPSANGYQRRTLRLVLSDLALPELGRFLQSWQRTQEVWTVSQVGLRHEGSNRDPSADRWTVTMVLSATYIDPTVRPTP